MNPDELIGGHAPGNLTPEEKRKLYRAALTDQTVFDALMEEEPLRELLADPESRGYVRAALEERRPETRFPYWMAAGLALLCLVAGAVWWRMREAPAVPTEVAMATPQPVEVVPEAAAPPSPPPAMRKPAVKSAKRSEGPAPAAGPVPAPRPASPVQVVAESTLERKAEAEVAAAAPPPVPLRIVRVGGEPADARYKAGERILLRLPGPVVAGQTLIVGGVGYELRAVEKEWEAGPIELRKGEFVAALSAAPAANEFAKSIRQRAAGSSSDAAARPGSPAAPAPLIRFTVE